MKNRTMNRTKTLAIVIAAVIVAGLARGQGKTPNEIRRFIDSLGDLQFLRHYVTGSLVPNTGGYYFPALA